MIQHQTNRPTASARRVMRPAGARRTVLVAALLGISALSVTGAVPAGAQTTGLTYTGRAAAVYSPTGVTLLGAQLIAPETVVCQAGPLPAAGGNFTACNGNVTLPASLGSVEVLNESVTGAAGTSSASSEVASANLLPTTIGGILGIGGLNANITATVLNAATSVTCSSHTKSSSLATLGLNGSSVLPASTTPNTSVSLLNNGLILTTNYQHYDAATNTATASPLKIEFPANGPLNGIITGTIFVSYAQSDLHNCPPPVISEFPTGLVVPAAAIGLLGAGLVVLRRRGRVSTV